MASANNRGHEMRLVVPAEEDGVEAVGERARIYYVASSRAPLNSEYRMISPGTFVFPGSRVRQILDNEQPDLVEICDKYSLNYCGGMLRVGMFKDVRCKPLVVGLSCERMDDNVRAYLGWNWFGRRLVPFYMKWLYFSLFDHHIANSEYTAAELRTASAGHPIRRGVWIRPMGVETRELSPAHRSSLARHHLRQTIGASAEARLLLYVGRLVPEKNLGLLLATLETLRKDLSHDWRLILVGDGIERKRFLKEAERRAPQAVSWFGHIQDRSELARLYANCDVFVHPNPREPFGIAPLEAMASGLPVVVPDHGGVLSYADTTNAWIAAPDGAAFAAAACDAVREGVTKELRVRSALATAARFRWDRVAASFLDLYEDLVSHREQPTRPASFFSTPPNGNGGRTARFTAALVQRLLTVLPRASGSLSHQ
jgi:alpha-1,6-mannosyltransferase